MNVVEGRSTGWTPSAPQWAQARNAVSTDREFVMRWLPHLVADGCPPWRSPRKAFAAYVAVVENILQMPGRGATLLIADDVRGKPVGFALIAQTIHCYARERCGYVAQVLALSDSVTLAKRVTEMLLVAAGDWSHSFGGYLRRPDEVWTGNPTVVFSETRPKAIEPPNARRFSPAASLLGPTTSKPLR